MGLSSAVLWWEEWQLRILVLGSLFVQYLLFFSAPFRKFAIPSWYRSIIWLSYLGSDALAIYALATLFSRQRKQDYNTVQGNGILEVVWAPVLLMHLGGQDCITAYNIEDNDLWRRHALTAVSQVTVAIYVFYKSWPGGDKRLLQVVFLLFTPGILKCLEKPWALKSASFNSLVSLSPASHSRKASRRAEAIPLEEYVQKARVFVHSDCQRQAQGNRDVADLELNHVPQSHGEPNEVDLEGNRTRQAQGQDDESSRQRQAREKKKRMELEARKLFADLASPYPDRLTVLKSFLVFGDDQEAYDWLQKGLFDTFDRLYTKWKFASMVLKIDQDLIQIDDAKKTFYFHIRGAAMYLPLAAIGLFHKSHREAYNGHDIKVTYALLCCTAALEWFSIAISMYSMAISVWLIRAKSPMAISMRSRKARFSDALPQYSVVRFFASNKNHTKNMCSSSFKITMLVLGHVKGWWKEHITDVASYWRFSDHRGQWTVQHKGCNQKLGWSLNRPFDESVLLWHIATDLCFYYHSDPSASHENSMVCREISNYMVYLLFVNPEMLLSGTRRDLFMEANAELEEILKGDKPLLKKILKGDKPLLMEILRGNKSFLEFLKRKGPSSEEIERGFMQVIEHRGQDPGYTEPLTEAEQHPSAEEGFIQDAWKISKALLSLGDEKMWEVIEGVWVEMLCFSASRCRGYLHAKSMGSGVELLTYVWFLLSRMGMKTLPERLQRMVLSSGGGNGCTPTSTSQIHGTEYPTRFRHLRPDEEAAAGACTSQSQEILPAE